MDEIKNTVKFFKEDLWKDQRKLDVFSDHNGIMRIKKYYDTQEEYDTEVSVISYLRNNGVLGIPDIFKYGDRVSCMPYYRGIRLFNLFVELDNLTQYYGDEANGIKSTLIKKCENNQKNIQNMLIKWRETQGNREAYPHAKINVIVSILSVILGIKINKKKIEEEIEDINLYWKQVASVPFRDATCKNIILSSPKLFLENFDGNSEEQRRKYIIDSILGGYHYEWMDSPIYDIDFSSCVHDTTYEDDVISLKYHERTWHGKMPTAKELIWNGEADCKRAAVTFLIRYFRFGGRKAAYRLIHPKAHRIRFKFDNDIFYFERLPIIMRDIWPNCEMEYPNLLRFVEVVAQQLKVYNVTTDLFLEYGYTGSRYYTDVYPN